MQQPLNRFLLLQPAWLPTVLFIPLLYALGWLAAVPLTLLGLPTDQLSLTGTVLSFALFLLVMPRWAALRWSAAHPWRALGIRNNSPQTHRGLAALLNGLLIACCLLSLIAAPLLTCNWAHWHWQGTWGLAFNALLLLFGVGLAEELIFRVWLWEELRQTKRKHYAIIGQALIFSVVHTRFNLGLLAMTGLLIGLFLLGCVLALLRHRDHGSIWSCVGLHGGLVSGWFILNQCLIAIKDDAPTWLIGPGDTQPNPLGGAVAIGALLICAHIFKRKNNETGTNAHIKTY